MSPLANLLTQLKNAQAVHKDEITVPFSNLKQEVVRILQKAGYVAQVEKKNKKGKKAELPFLHITLKYHDGEGVIRGARLVSKPSRRLYSGKSDLQKVQNGFGISVVTTSKGLMTGDEAKKAGVGGEVMFEIW